MNDDEFIYKPQDVNYLGFLEAQLRDLGGIATLAYELIQNGDAGGRTLSATWRFNRVSVARYTSPMPPAPNLAVIS